MCIRDRSKNSTVANIIGKRASKELRVDDIVNIGIGIPEMVSRFARKSGMLDMVTLTVESGGIGGFPVSGEAFGAMIGAASVYDMANQFDLYDNGGLDVCFMGALEVDKEGNVNAPVSYTHLLELYRKQLQVRRLHLHM